MRNEAVKMKAVHIARLMLDGGRYYSIHRANHRGNRKDSFREEKCIIVWQFNTNTAWKIETAGIFLYDTTDERYPVQELLDFLEPKLLAKK